MFSYDNSSNIVGHIKINNVINSDILKYSDNNYYLNHDSNNNRSSDGAIFLDYRINSNNKVVIIYGHNSNNVFGNLENYMDYDYYKDNQYINVELFGNKYLYKIFSVYVETSDLYYTRVKFNNDNEYLNHINRLKSNSFYDSDVTLTSNDNIVILQTCSSDNRYRFYDKKYLLIIGKKV